MSALQFMMSYIIIPLIVAITIAVNLFPTSSYAENSGSSNIEMVKVLSFNSWNGNVLFKRGVVEIFESVPTYMEDGQRKAYSFKDWHGEKWHVVRYVWNGRDLRFIENFLSSSAEYDEKLSTDDKCDDFTNVNFRDYPWMKAIPVERRVKGFQRHDIDKDGVEEILLVSGYEPEDRGYEPYDIVYLAIFNFNSKKEYDRQEMVVTNRAYFCNLKIKDLNSDGIDEIIIKAHSPGVGGGSEAALVYNVIRHPGEAEERGGTKKRLIVIKKWDFHSSRGSEVVEKGKGEYVWPVRPPNQAKPIQVKYEGNSSAIKSLNRLGGVPEANEELVSASKKHKRVAKNLSGCDVSWELKIDISRFGWSRIIPAHRLVKGFITHDFDGDGEEEVVVLSSNKIPASKHIELRPYNFLTVIAKNPDGKYQVFEKIIGFYSPLCRLSVRDVNYDGMHDILLKRSYEYKGRRRSWIDIYGLKYINHQP